MTTDERLDRLDERFDRMDKRLDRMDERFDRVDKRFDRIDQSIGDLARTVASLAQTVATLSQTVAESTQNLKTLTQYVLDFRTETATRFQAVELRLDLMGATVSSLDMRLLPFTKAVFDFGVLATEQARRSRLVDPAA